MKKEKDLLILDRANDVGFSIRKQRVIPHPGNVHSFLRYISENSRRGFWGTGAIKQISEQLQKEMPGLKGFGESMLKRMRTFYEEWSPYINRYPAGTDLQLSSSQQDNNRDSIQYPMGTELRIDEYEMLSEIRQPMGDELNWSEFVQVPFSHHVLILRKRESFEEIGLKATKNNFKILKTYLILMKIDIFIIFLFSFTNSNG